MGCRERRLSFFATVRLASKATIRGRDVAAGQKRLVDAQAFHLFPNLLGRVAGATRRGVA